jgi:hypothetical protein
MLPCSLILAYQGLEEDNLHQKSPGPSGWGLMQQASPLLIAKKRLAKKPIRMTLDRCNLRRHKLRTRTMRLGTLNVQGIRNKTGEIIKGWEELKQDIMILTETKKKGNGVEILGPYLHFYSGVPKKKRAKRGVSILVKKSYKRYITTWEAVNENMIKLLWDTLGLSDTQLQYSNDNSIYSQ